MSKPNPNEEGLGPLERGRLRYHQKDYKGALSAFNEAVNISTSHLLVNALDHRAAAYEKLGQLQPALRDAKKMIDLQGDVSKGYLRCGKILQLKGENALALKIYERGLGKVRIGGDAQRTLLQSMFNKLQRSQNPGKTLDPLQYLPLELAEMVCLQMTMRDRVVCLAVSKSWKRLLESSTKLWTTLDTTPAKKPISFKSFKAHLRRSNYTLDNAIITMKASFDAERMRYLSRTCLKLRTLEIRGAGVIGDSLLAALPEAKNLENLIVGPQVHIRLRTVQAALRSCNHSLVRISFLGITDAPHMRAVIPGEWPRMDSLQTIHFSSMLYGRTFDFVRLQDATPNLKSLILNNWHFAPTAIHDLTAWSKLEHLELSNSGLETLPNLPTTLKHLNLSHNSRLNDQAGEEISKLPMLETLNIYGTFITAQGLMNLTSESIKNSTLKDLNVGNRLNSFTNMPPEEEFPASESVQKLSIASLIVGDKQAMGIVDLYPNLRTLDASQTKITGVAVKYFVQKGITSLKLNECSSISNDAIEWAKGKGVEVEFNFPSHIPRGFRDAMSGNF